MSQKKTKSNNVPEAALCHKKYQKKEEDKTLNIFGKFRNREHRCVTKILNFTNDTNWTETNPK